MSAFPRRWCRPDDLELDPERAFASLEPRVQKVAAAWCALVFVAAKTTWSTSSYAMKHALEDDTAMRRRVYLTSEEFAGAMVAAGHSIAEQVGANFLFRVRPRVRRSRLPARDRWSKDVCSIAWCSPLERQHFDELVAQLPDGVG